MGEGKKSEENKPIPKHCHTTPTHVHTLRYIHSQTYRYTVAQARGPRHTYRLTHMNQTHQVL